MENKIAVFGGTFNPIHNGHLAMARRALDQFDPDTVIFLPTGHTAYKEFSGDEMSRHRCRMVELAIEVEPRFQISYRESESETVNFTYQTLERMQNEHPGAKLYFILGGDSLRDLPKWRHPERVCEKAVILVAARQEADEDETDRLIAEMTARFHGDFLRLDTPLMDISSTEIRRRVKEGLDIRGMVPSAVADYICENRLYLY